jgi:Domain of unknown function (DUF4864)
MMRASRQLLAAVAWVLCAGAAHAAVTATASLPDDDWRAIQQVISAQLTALKAGEGETAMGFAAPGIRAQFGTPERFLQMVRTSYAPLLDARYTQFLEGAVIEGAIIQPLRLVLPDNTVLVALYQMQRLPDGHWRIAGCALAPSTVKAT